MSVWQRFENIVLGIISILGGVLMMEAPFEGYLYVALMLSFSLMVKGATYLIYYFLMARHMVGGRATLYMGTLILDFGAFTLTMLDEPRFYVMLYLLIIHAFGGLVDVLRAFEARRMGASSWRMKAGQGVSNLLLALFCLVFVRSIRLLVYVYCLGLIYAGIMHIVSAFRRTALVYIQ